MEKKNTAVKAASVKSLINKLNKAFKSRNNKRYDDPQKKLDLFNEIDAIIDQIRAAGNDVKFDYYYGQYFAKYDADGNEQFVTYVRETLVYRAIYSASSEQVAEAKARTDLELESIDLLREPWLDDTIVKVI